MSEPVDRDRDLRSLLETLEPLTRDALRRVLIHDQADRDAVSSQLLRYRDGRGDDWVEIIDLLTMYPDARRQGRPIAWGDCGRKSMKACA